MNKPQRDHFAMIPRLVDDLDLDPYVHRLYCHIKTVTGESGSCWESTKTLAKRSRISVGKVSTGKRILQDKGLIRIQKRRGPGGCYDVITAVDVWALNHARYADQSNSRDDDAGRRSPREREVVRARSQRSSRGTERSPGEPQGSQDAIQRSPREPKKKYKEERPEPKIEEEFVSTSSKPPQAGSPETPPEAATWEIVLDGLQGMVLRDDFDILYRNTRCVGVAPDGAWRVEIPDGHALGLMGHPRVQVVLRRALRYAGVPDVQLRFELRRRKP